MCSVAFQLERLGKDYDKRIGLGYCIIVIVIVWVVLTLNERDTELWRH